MQVQLVETDEAQLQDTPAHLPYLPGLDGLRALAVVAVLLYHADLEIYGGYLGVESFFVLSGFLITALLLLDRENNGHVRLKAFWIRRARRLLPALFVMLAGTLTLTAVLLPGEFAATARDTLAAIAYATNWYLIADGQSYFDAVERPSLLRHLWSLAIEEQFYVVWPLLFALGMRLLRRRGLLALTLLAAIASSLLMAVLFDPDVDPSRIYYGTDTRVAAILLGAALAMVWRPGRANSATNTASGSRRYLGLALDGAGLLALGGLLVAYALLSDRHPLLYRGGFSLVAIATAVVLGVTTHPQARLTPWLLERQPLRWIGLRSYGIYLWHWPIFMVTRPGVDMPDGGWQLQLLRFGLAFGLAAVSYSFVELPIRRGALERVWRALRRRIASAEATKATAADGHPDADFAARAAAAAAAARPVKRFGQLMRWPHIWYRRWAPLIATSLLLVGVTYVTASVSQAAMRSGLAEVATLESALPRTTAATPTARATAGQLPHPDDAGGVADRHATAARSSPAEDQAAQTQAQPPAIDPALAGALQQILDSAVADGTIPGAVLTVSLPNGASWTGASGLADPEDGVAMVPETRVRIGSLSKMFTAVVVLQLVQEGKIDLDAPVATWLPDLLPNADVITVRELLQHTSGVYDYLEDRKFLSRAYDDPERVWQPRELVEHAVDLPPSFAPGAENRWDYSNTNYVILGMIVEQATGRPLAQELRQRIFEPLGLHATYALPDDTVEGPQARGYSKSVDQTDVAMSFTFAAANIVTTVDDLRVFGSALFTDRLLKPTTREQMQQFVNGKGQYDMTDLEYGLGLMRYSLPVGPGPNDQPRPAEASRVVGHIGGFGGFRSALWYVPADGTLVALSVNQASTDPNDLATQVFDAILQHEGR
ncbi:MAG TPA: serine hydrolase [Roseiflexaceae bacterium]|nr:serine hydrolase [Roseiflexaceae bacterium]